MNFVNQEFLILLVSSPIILYIISLIEASRSAMHWWTLVTLNIKFSDKPIADKQLIIISVWKLNTGPVVAAHTT